MDLSARHIAWAVVVAAALHAGVAIAVFWRPATSGAIATGIGGLEVSLGAAGGSPGTADPVASEEAEAAEPDASNVVEALPPDAVEAEAVQATALSPTDLSEPQALAEAAPKGPEIEVAPVTLESPARVIAELPTEEPAPQVEEAPPETETAGTDPDAFAAPMPRVKPNPPPRRRGAEPRGTQPKRTAPKPERSATREQAGARKAAHAEPAQQASASPTNGRSEAGTSGGAEENTGQQTARRSGGDLGAKRDYMARIAAILARNKRYPRRAQSRRQEGTGHFYFVIDANGRISAARVQKSSGHSLLDKELLDLARRVNLPPIPDTIGTSRLEIVVPIRFALR